ncbi:MAG: hypothetical protein ACF8NJ_06960 [Phycisphaerales bacterium JB038]
MPTAQQQVQRDRDRFYAILQDLEARVGKQLLRDCHGRLNWPNRGVYFFFESGEHRRDGCTPRVVRIGTHALKATSRTTLWKRLHQHRGTGAGLGNHRGSIFRLHIGRALLRRGDVTLQPDTWGRGSSAKRPTTGHEASVEQAVSVYLGAMPFLWVAADDEPGPHCTRAVLETNSIALLSALGADPESADEASPDWLGRHAAAEAVRESKLWNVRDVTAAYEPSFLDLLASCAKRTEPL